MSDIQITAESTEVPNIQNPVRIVHFSGQLDETNVDEKSQLIYNLIEELSMHTHIIFDFENLEYMNSKSLGYLSDWYTKIVEKEAQLVIAAPKPNIEDILNVIGLSQIIPVVSHIEDAKNTLMQ